MKHTGRDVIAMLLIGFLIYAFFEVAGFVGGIEDAATELGKEFSGESQ
jgi:hypothetical protein